MVNPRAILLAGVIAGLPFGTLRADGKFFGRDAASPGEPFQRAIIAHADGRELLIVQPQLVGSAKEFAWVLPVPAAPDLGHMESGDAGFLFSVFSSRTRPAVFHWGSYLLIGLLGLLVAGIIFALLPWPRKIPRVYRMLALPVPVVIVLVTGFFVPTTMAPRGAPMEAVELLRSERLGIYDVQVVRSASPAAMKAWLEERGFRVGSEDGDVLRSYAERGWCFVTARIASEAPGVQEGLIHALVLSFPVPEPIYPFALTASGGGETDVLLYVFADHKVAHPALGLQYAGPDSDFGLWSQIALSLEVGKEDEDVPFAIHPAAGGRLQAPPRNPGFLTKLRGRLSARNVRGDVILGRAPDDSPFRETVWGW